MVAARAGICVVLALLVGTQAAKVTPMEKVITLLKDLSTKVAAEGAKEAAQYDKYACFCKEQADEKLYSIEKSDAKIDRLKAEIKELDTAIASLNSEVSDLAKKISGLEAEIKTKTEKREKEHTKYEAQAKDMNEAIDSCGAAIDALKNSKSSMKGAKLDLAQVKKISSALLANPMVAAASGAVALIAELSSGKAAPKFEYQSNDIIATLEGLQATFKSMKKDLDFQESDTNSAFESNRLGLQNEKTFAEKEKGEKETTAEEKTEEVNTSKNDKDEEQKDRDSDNTFMNDLTKQCEETAQTFDQRSKTRSEEITTLAEATTELQKGAVPNFSANKKLMGAVQMKQVVHKAFIQPTSFLQTSEDHVQSGKQDKVVQQVLSLLHAAAGKTGSAELANAAMRVKMAEDHFVKVRALVKDLIAKLEADAKSEATQKGVCDKGMKKAVADRDSANAQIEVANAKITTLTAKKNQLKDDINTLTSDIADLKKAMLEATELRNGDKADNTKTLAMSEEAVDSVKMALDLLSTFYKKAGFVQTVYTPPKADRSGNTVGDLAPEVFDSNYKGSQSESKGIVGILEVILSDFERTGKKTTQDEKDSQEAFDQLEKETTEDIKTKNDSIKKKDGELADARSDLIDQEQALMDGKDLLSSAQSSLEGLEAMCVKGEETYAERVQKRVDEIEALKNAMEILTNWQAS